jgi:hypothetical protein
MRPRCLCSSAAAYPGGLSQVEELRPRGRLACRSCAVLWESQSLLHHRAPFPLSPSNGRMSGGTVPLRHPRHALPLRTSRSRRGMGDHPAAADRPASWPRCHTPRPLRRGTPRVGSLLGCPQAHLRRQARGSGECPNPRKGLAQNQFHPAYPMLRPWRGRGGEEQPETAVAVH